MFDTHKNNAYTKGALFVPLPNLRIAAMALPQRAVYWIGQTNDENFQRMLERVLKLLEENSTEEINLFITSAGGSPVVYAFYDLVRAHRINLRTIGSGYVDSHALILLMAGHERLLTPNTSMSLHETGFESSKKGLLRTAEVRSIAEEQELLDQRYDRIIAHGSRGKLTPKKVRELKRGFTVLTAKEAIKLGIADGIYKT